MVTHQFEQVTKNYLYEIIALEIEQKILSGEIKVGDKLPSENSLANMFGVSRNVIREALRGLKEWGLITIKTGSGAYVTRPDPEIIKESFNRLITLSGFTLDEFFDVRILLESQAAYKAALYITNLELNELEQTICAMKVASTSTDWAKQELLFHNNIAKASRNKLICALISSMSDIMSDFFAKGYLFIDYRSVDIQENQELNNNQLAIYSHELIYNSLKHHHQNQSREAMKLHLVRARQAYVE